MAYKRKTTRPYRRITPATIAKFDAAFIQEGNGAGAIAIIEPDIKDQSRRAWIINQKKQELDAGEYIDMKLQRSAIEAVERVNQMVQSKDEHIATKNAHFVIDHVRGKALQRSESKHLNLNIEAILE